MSQNGLRERIVSALNEEMNLTTYFYLDAIRRAGFNIKDSYIVDGITKVEVFSPENVYITIDQSIPEVHVFSMYTSDGKLEQQYEVDTEDMLYKRSLIQALKKFKSVL